jgi:(heptosyl)LPS beta-1,4-glucosyltransferase
MYFLKRGFLDGRHGLLLAILSANTTFTRYADLWLRDYVKQQASMDAGLEDKTQRNNDDSK